MVFLLGLFVVNPLMLRSLRAAASDDAADQGCASWRRGGGLALSLALIVSAMPLLFSLTRDVHRIDGVLAATRTPASGANMGTPDMPGEEWHAYGRTGYGQR